MGSPVEPTAVEHWYAELEEISTISEILIYTTCSGRSGKESTTTGSPPPDIFSRASGGGSSSCVPRRRAEGAPRHDPPPPPESDGSNGPLSPSLRAGGGHSGWQPRRVVHTPFTVTRTCQYGRLRRPRGGAEGLYGRRWPNPAGAESYHVRWGRALGHSGFIARLRRTPTTSMPQSAAFA